MSNLHLHRTSRVCFPKTQARWCRDSEDPSSNTGWHRDADPWNRTHTGRVGVGADHATLRNRAVSHIKGSTKAKRSRKTTNRAHMHTVESCGKLTASPAVASTSVSRRFFSPYVVWMELGGSVLTAHDKDQLWVFHWYIQTEGAS